ncbi:hypothetical protein IAU59_006625 [Kwoniella sp. CBS 9459]
MTSLHVKMEDEDDLADMVNISPPSTTTTLVPDNNNSQSPTSSGDISNVHAANAASASASSDSQSSAASYSDPSFSSDDLDSVSADTSVHAEAMSTPATKRDGSNCPPSNGHTGATILGNGPSSENAKHGGTRTAANVKGDGEVLRDVQSVVEDTVKRVRQQSDKFQSAAQPYADKTRSFAEQRPVLFTFLVIWATFSAIPILFFLTFGLITTAVIASTAIFFLALTAIGTVLLAATVLICTLCGGLLVLFPVLCISTFLAFGALSTLVGIFLAHRLYLHVSLTAAEDKAGFSLATLMRGTVSWIDETIERIPLPFEYTFPRLSSAASYADRKDFSQQYGPDPLVPASYNEKYPDITFTQLGQAGGLDEKWPGAITDRAAYQKNDLSTARPHTNATSDGRLALDEDEIEKMNGLGAKNVTGNAYAHPEEDNEFVGSILSEKEGLRYESKPTPRLDSWPPAPNVKAL